MMFLSNLKMFLKKPFWPLNARRESNKEYSFVMKIIKLTGIDCSNLNIK